MNRWGKSVAAIIWSRTMRDVAGVNVFLFMIGRKDFPGRAGGRTDQIDAITVVLALRYITILTSVVIRSRRKSECGASGRCEAEVPAMKRRDAARNVSAAQPNLSPTVQSPSFSAPSRTRSSIVRAAGVADGLLCPTSKMSHAGSWRAACRIRFSNLWFRISHT
jgi:hypothetical protein